jgi:hypothetical protein
MTYASRLIAVRQGSRRLRLPKLIVPVLCAIGLLAGAASAQQPTPAQRNAIKSACRSDFMAQCSGVTPGGREALSCLQQHNDTLSAACQKAIGALSGTKPTAAAPATTPPTAATAPAAPAATGQSQAGQTPAAQPTQAQRSAVKSACRSDFMAQCSGVTPGGRDALVCLQQHSASLSPSCQQAVSAIGGGAAMGAPATAPAARAQAAPSFTPRQELFVLRESCGPDFRTYCRMVPLGGGRGIACLRNNLQRVSPSCQKVLTSGL